MCTYPAPGSFTYSSSNSAVSAYNSKTVVVTQNYPLNAGAQWLDGPFNYGNYEFFAADVTGDGRADMVGVLPQYERVVVWKANSTGTGFDGGVEWYGGPFNYTGYEFKVADVTGDGRADVVGILPQYERMVVWKANSTGTGFEGGVEWYGGPFNYTGYEFQVADMTGDGRADVVGILPQYERVVVWKANATGIGFAGGVEWYGGPFNYTGYEFHVADMTGDGRADVVAIASGDERIVVWPTNTDGIAGSRSLGGQEWLNGPFNYSDYLFKVADIDGDKKADVVGFNTWGERVVVWTTHVGGTLSNGGAEWYKGPFNYGAYGFLLADVTGKPTSTTNGKADVIRYDSYSERFVVWTAK